MKKLYLIGGFDGNEYYDIGLFDSLEIFYNVIRDDYNSEKKQCEKLYGYYEYSFENYIECRFWIRELEINKFVYTPD